MQTAIKDVRAKSSESSVWVLAVAQFYSSCLCSQLSLVISGPRSILMTCNVMSVSISAGCCMKLLRPLSNLQGTRWLKAMQIKLHVWWQPQTYKKVIFIQQHHKQHLQVHYSFVFIVLFYVLPCHCMYSIACTGLMNVKYLIYLLCVLDVSICSVCVCVYVL